jgi:hypothetical protein
MVERETKVVWRGKSALRRTAASLGCLVGLFVVTAGSAHAAVALLMEEPYGAFGAMNPTGHAAIYLNHVCADSPTSLRACHAGEYGVVISRYHKVDGYDWIAMPLLGYLYAVDNLSDLPAVADREKVAALQDAYRRAHLMDLAPDNKKGEAPKGEWTELVGEAYIRTMHGFEVDSTAEQDERFMATFNDRKNVGHFNLLFHNCADFSRMVLDIYMPHAVHRNFIADFGLMTPKQVARSLVAYSQKNPEVNMNAFVIPQVEGTIPRSHAVDGVTESLVKSKKYLIPMTILAPAVTGAVVVAYLADGRLKLPKGTPVFNIGDEETTTEPSSSPSTEPVRQPLPATQSPVAAADPAANPL